MSKKQTRAGCMVRWTISMAMVLLVAAPAHADRLKDIANLRGARPNQLMGYGLVVGLAGTGDDTSAPFSGESVVTLLARLGTNVDPTGLRLKNVAAVVVTAELPAFVKTGQKIDVTVSSIGTAKSLDGGTLVVTPLKGADGKVYAVGQGPISVVGFALVGQSGSMIEKNHPTVGRIPNGALVEREVPVELRRKELEIALKRPDFTTAVRLVAAIEATLFRVNTDAPEPEPEPAKKKKGKRGGKSQPVEEPVGDAAPDFSMEPVLNEDGQPYVYARDPGTIVLNVPEQYMERIPVLMAMLEAIEVVPDIPTRVVINERTGTVVLGSGVRLSAVAIAHAGLTVRIDENPESSQPGGFAEGETVILERSELSVAEGAGPLFAVGPGASLSEVVRALNTIGVKPRDLVAILQALKTAGALHAELEIQ